MLLGERGIAAGLIAWGTSAQFGEFLRAIFVGGPFRIALEGSGLALMVAGGLAFSIMAVVDARRASANPQPGRPRRYATLPDYLADHPRVHYVEALCPPVAFWFVEAVPAYGGSGDEVMTFAFEREGTKAEMLVPAHDAVCDASGFELQGVCPHEGELRRWRFQYEAGEPTDAVVRPV